MPTEDIIVMGSSIINNPIGYAYDNRGDSNDYVDVRGGENVFAPDAVVVFTADNISNNGEFSSNSQITDIVVYASAADYVNGIPLYTYDIAPSQNPWWWGNNDDTGELVSGSVRAMGDTYINVAADGFRSNDPGAPDLDQLFIAPGVDLSDPGTDIIMQDTDVDYDGDGVISGNENGNDTFSIENNVFAEAAIAAAICLTRGTLIDTPKGPMFIEALQEGDQVNTLDNGPQTIRWIGARKMRAEGTMAPVLIKAGALGNVRDLKVSQNHRMLLRGPQAQVLFGERDVLVAAKHLVNDDKIRLQSGGVVEYFHMLFDDHQIIFAESCPTESLYPGKEALEAVSVEARDEILAIFPELEQNIGQLSRYELKAWEAKALKHAV
ncbi:Hint domain-containing protein [Pacificibacter maritimus]|uniref:Hint domain-containing protein n=1 Tax=Pacificibacter maritimus TaxID=762213 RepID=A0A3N4UMR9_9RHOB|nr:Hint domain-containing protein [Pacificibacter maritimus]RPE71902.1 Hint domain-containing protein [Pacificibacter maritimus]